MGRENRQLEVRLGEKGLLVGRLFISSGRRSGFAYDERWLASHMERLMRDVLAESQ